MASKSELAHIDRTHAKYISAQAKQFVEQVARMSLTQDGAEAIDTVNGLIRAARELTGVKANPQDDAAD